MFHGDVVHAREGADKCLRASNTLRDGCKSVQTQSCSSNSHDIGAERHTGTRRNADLLVFCSVSCSMDDAVYAQEGADKMSQSIQCPSLWLQKRSNSHDVEDIAPIFLYSSQCYVPSMMACMRAGGGGWVTSEHRSPCLYTGYRQKPALKLRAAAQTDMSDNMSGRYVPLSHLSVCYVPSTFVCMRGRARTSDFSVHQRPFAMAAKHKPTLKLRAASKEI